MKIALAQINTTVGAIARNADRAIATLEQARDRGADFVLFPEMTLTGYPPNDLLDRPSFITHNLEALDRVARATTDLPAALVGHAHRDERSEGKHLFNAVAFCAEGAVRSIHSKTLLPTYDVFDEMRYFSAAREHPVLELGGLRFGVSICEDIWNDAVFWGRRGQRRYEADPIEILAGQGVDYFVNIAASPFTEGKRALKREMFASVARRHARPLIHVNLVGGNDSLIFDGWSNVFGPDGSVLAQAADFEESLLVFDTDAPDRGAFERVSEEEIETIHNALVLGIRDYCGKCGFRSTVVGLSGGVDSAVTATLAARALGPDKVLGVALPSRFSSDHSRTDAAALARNLGIAFREIAIEPIYEAYLKIMEPHFEGREFDATEENLQARIRGNILMALSNKFGHLLLSTGNKSEMAVGYCTLYGDMSGGLAVLSDVPKTLVYELARFMNRSSETIPENTLRKPPSAELRPDQKDSDSLPPYEILDPIIRAYVEEQIYIDEIVARGFDRDIVERVIRMIERNEYKRRQAAIGLKITHRAFGYGRRMPVARGTDGGS
ncbi:NAD+ synthase [Candidatus Sumerlaeota bacterium]|nr:NAD+ synthase [Candidatus Sumerlaeota bacterium]